MVAILTAKDYERIRRAYNAREERVVLDYTYIGRRLVVAVKRPGKVWHGDWLIQVADYNGNVTTRQNFESVEDMMQYADY